ncbi:Transcriptional activator RamA [Klebsiella pneumoniae]|nr:Transcriptional activator RamA [Klebsiella pneumoniae]
MITCINRCVLMISLAMPGIRNGICNGCFYSTKGRAWGAIFAKRKLLLAARDLRDTDQRVYDICLKYGFDSQQTFTRVFTRTFNQPPGAYRKENHSRAH